MEALEYAEKALRFDPKHVTRSKASNVGINCISFHSFVWKYQARTNFHSEVVTCVITTKCKLLYICCEDRTLILTLIIDCVLQSDHDTYQILRSYTCMHAS